MKVKYLVLIEMVNNSEIKILFKRYQTYQFIKPLIPFNYHLFHIWGALQLIKQMSLADLEQVSIFVQI